MNIPALIIFGAFDFFVSSLFRSFDSLSKCRSFVLVSQFRAFSYEPGYWAGPVGGTSFVFCSYVKFNPGYRDEKCRKGPKYPWTRTPT